MRVTELIQRLRQIEANGGGEAVTNIAGIGYWNDDVITLEIDWENHPADYVPGLTKLVEVF